MSSQRQLKQPFTLSRKIYKVFPKTNANNSTKSPKAELLALFFIVIS